MKINKVNIGLAIEQRLNELNMSKAEFGRLIGIPQQNVNRILSRVSIDTEKLVEICEVLEYNFFKEYFDGSAVISADHGGIAAGGSISGGTTMGAGSISTTNNYGEGCGDSEPSPIVQTLTESVATLTRELETSQEQKSRLIGIIEKLTEK